MKIEKLVKEESKMENVKEFISIERKNFIEYAEKLAVLESNFRTYVLEKLSEKSYQKAADEYNAEVNKLKQIINQVNAKLMQINNNVNYFSQEDVDKINMKLGKIWRIIIANLCFCDEYGNVRLTDDEEVDKNLYKQIYEKHLKDLKDFMYDFINIINILFSK